MTREHALAQDELNLVVHKIRQIARETTLDYAIRVGSLIIHYFYGGDMKKWRERGPKATSFRRLATHPDLPMSASALYRCVAIFELCERFDVVTRCTRITVSHLRVVLRLSADEQLRMISIANAENWSVRRLAEEVNGNKARGAARGGRRQSADAVRQARALGRILKLSAALLPGLREMRDLLHEDFDLLEDAIASSVRDLERAHRIWLQHLEPAGESSRAPSHALPAFEPDESGADPEESETCP